MQKFRLEENGFNAFEFIIRGFILRIMLYMHRTKL